MNWSKEELARMTENWLSVATYPGVFIITGQRGSGKTALMLWLTEIIAQKYKISPSVMGIPDDKVPLLPRNFLPINTTDEIAKAEKSVVALDEGSHTWHARLSMSKTNIVFDKIISLSRQRLQTLLVTVHHTRKLDINLIADADGVFCKKPALFHAEFERPGMGQFTQKAWQEFKQIKGNKKLFCYVKSDQFEGMLKNPLPSFWKQELSYAALSTSPGTNAGTSAGTSASTSLSKEPDLGSGYVVTPLDGLLNTVDIATGKRQRHFVTPLMRSRKVQIGEHLEKQIVWRLYCDSESGLMWWERCFR